MSSKIHRCHPAYEGDPEGFYGGESNNITQIIPCGPGWTALFYEPAIDDDSIYEEPVICWAFGTRYLLDFKFGFCREVIDYQEVYGVIVDVSMDRADTIILTPGNMRGGEMHLLGYRPPDNSNHETTNMDYWKTMLKEIKMRKTKNPGRVDQGSL
jgi:hypothetical protein